MKNNVITFRVVPGYEKMEVSRCGIIRNAETKYVYKAHHYEIPKGVPKTGARYDRVCCIRANSDGEMVNSSLKVHRAVALAYINNPHNYPQVDHVDGDIYNNHMKNLRWCSAKMNSRWKVGRMKFNK